ncbi:hypothetical protein [Pseudomonas sp. NPDC088444]|uniref:hypothetical protein n=1 Tax=Pseudomonas sp. NPDC088444 TaxID=3364456 RepID=UPI00384EA26A
MTIFIDVNMIKTIVTAVFPPLQRREPLSRSDRFYKLLSQCTVAVQPARNILRKVFLRISQISNGVSTLIQLPTADVSRCRRFNGLQIAYRRIPELNVTGGFVGGLMGSGKSRWVEVFNSSLAMFSLASIPPLAASEPSTLLDASMPILSRETPAFATPPIPRHDATDGVDE